MPKEKTTETQILEAAKSVFMIKGKAGARMQEIADKAGINKSLLHYYFRSKNKLFDAVFEYVFQKFAPNLFDIFKEDIPFTEKICKFSDGYIDVISRNPFIPVFVINELNNKKSDKLIAGIKSLGVKTDIVEQQILEQIKQGNIRKIDPVHFMIDIIALNVFPFAAQPIINKMFFEDDNKGHQQFMRERKEHVKSMILNYLRPQ
ncbi:MAG: TetR/AcrR family transcriptional regulator [Bacteroidota bacterium]|nr:TetR/AcrR family transcriptional regulator [Bacteroidota bacterium]